MGHESAIIDPDDYEAFRDIPTRDLPDTYDEWLKLTAKSRRDWERHGAQIVEVKVNSEEFARYLRAVHQPANMKTLRDFVIEKIGRDI